MARNAAATRERIYQAFVKICREEGFSQVGVNNVAREAGVSKMLIYRYFGGLEGIAGEYATRGDFWSIFQPSRMQELEEMTKNTRAAVWAKRLIDGMHELRQRPEAIAMYRAEVGEPNPVVQAITHIRNEQLKQMVVASKVIPEVDANAITTILANGVVHLVLLEANRPVVTDIDLRTPEGWLRIARAISFLYEAIDEKIQRLEDNHRDART